MPVLQLALTSKTLTDQQLFDLSNNFIRPQLAQVEGAAIPSPYGGKNRQVVVDLDPNALRSKGLSPADVTNAILAQNLILPSGTQKMGTFEYNVKLNGSPKELDELNDLPIKSIGGAVVTLRDVAHVRDGYSPQQNLVLVDGQRSVLTTIQKNGNALDPRHRRSREIAVADDPGRCTARTRSEHPDRSVDLRQSSRVRGDSRRARSPRRWQV